jgi:hypothetical protein
VCSLWARPNRPSIKWRALAPSSPAGSFLRAASRPMATISITPAAFAAIASTLPKGSTVAGRPDDDEGYLVTLDQRALDRLRTRRRPGESYSEAILRLAKG